MTQYFNFPEATDFNTVNWVHISYSQKLSEDFIERNADKVDWYGISEQQKLTEDFIEKNEDKIDWTRISIFQKLSEGFIERNTDKVDWIYISSRQKLSEGFIERNADKINWGNISFFQKLSEDFIERNADKVDWANISYSQKLSENFIERHKNKVNWTYVSHFQKLSESFIEKHKNKITPNEDSWLYSDVNTKLKAIKETNLYEIENDEYVVAYKGIRSDNYSKYNFQYLYEVGKEYESHCDCNLGDENSFGLSAWTEEDAREYCSEKLIKVRIHISDIGALVHGGYKLRCHKFTVIEEI